MLGQPFARDYERIVWVDADILFGDHAPRVTAGVAPEMVGAVDELATPTPALRQHIHPHTMEDYYAAAGLPASFDHIVQGGVLVLSPSHHRELLKRVYDSYEDPGPNLNYEMRPLSYELLRAGRVSWLDPRFNFLWALFKAYRLPVLLKYPTHPSASEAVERALNEVHCLHFAGATEEMDRAAGSALRRPEGRRRAASRIEPTRAAVALFVFARPDTTELVLNAARRARPRRLLVVANAPRPELAEEVERSERVKFLIERVDWDCEISTDYAKHHLGQTQRIETGLDWVFSLTEEAIVLEDDCVPDPSFFAFCDDLLERYREDDRVMSISGDNFQFDSPASRDSYYFSRYPHTWGWATWRRAWANYDPAMASWPELREGDWLEGVVDTPHAVAYWSHLFDQTHRERDAWDRAWVLACWLRQGLHAIPNVNLVTNVGFRDDATHTRPELRGVLNDLPTQPMRFPLRHPAAVRRNVDADAFTENLMFSGTIGEIFERLRATRRMQRAGR